MRTMIAAVMLATALAPASAAAPTRPAGPMVSGAAKPRHTLTIVSAFSCGYCKILDSQASDELRQKWIPLGLQVQSVPVVIAPTDVATTIVAACGDPAQYLHRVTLLFRMQGSILSDWRGIDADPAKKAMGDAAIAVPNGGGSERVARLAGLYEDAPALGLSAAQLRACLTDPARQRYPAAMDRFAAERWRIKGTPTVLLDGRLIGNTWQQVRPALAQAFATK